VKVLDQRFDLDGLPALRSAVAAHARHLGASPDCMAHLVIIASELASNAIRHGGGHGRLRLWRADSMLRCEVSDQGTGLSDSDSAGTHLPPPTSPGTRGLWIVRQLSTTLTIDTGALGTTIIAVLALNPDA
jgi:anti-sigma regulatory factor (Ser/Thr protein kinase)